MYKEIYVYLKEKKTTHLKTEKQIFEKKKYGIFLLRIKSYYIYLKSEWMRKVVHRKTKNADAESERAKGKLLAENCKWILIALKIEKKRKTNEYI